MWRRLFLSVSLIAAVIQCADGWAAKQASAAPPSAPVISGQRGDALFHGQEPLTGKIRGHDDMLPPETVRCANCHEAAPPNGASRRLSRVAPPHLDSALLLEYRQRRGGPPSRYDASAFCKLLRTGVDPAKILIAREMPSYEIDDAQCASLWVFALAKDNAAENSPSRTKAMSREATGAKP